MALTEAQKRNAEKNRKYWADREREALKHRITDEKEYDRQIKAIYDNMLDACQNEINAFYGRYAAKEQISIAEAKKRVSQADIEAFERKAKRYVKEKDFSDEANEEMRLYNLTMKVNRLEMLKANIGLETIAGHDELQKFMAGILKGRTMDELKRQAGILGKTVQNNAKMAHAIVNASFHNATFSDRIWQYQDIMRSDLSKLLQTGLIQGKNPRAIAKDLRKYWYGNDPKTGGGAVYCMERLMRTELARVQTEAQKQSFIRNGFEMYTFITNSGCCDICAALNGKHFKVAKMMPGENASPMHPHCRCSVAAYEDSADYEAWLDHLANGGTTESWQKIKARKAANHVENSNDAYYNRTRNRNAFKAIPHSDYTEPMTKKHVKGVMKDMGVSYGKAVVRLIHDDELIGRGLFGYTNPNGKEVQFYPDAFMSREELVKTIGHERIHLDQLEKYGPTNDSLIANEYEKEARASEQSWWDEYKKVTGYATSD